MEYLPGNSLDKLIGKIPSSLVVQLAGQLAKAARYLEEQDLVHRDIKPANVVISEDFQILTLLDLGVVHPLISEKDEWQLSGEEFVATLRYSPPEFVRREEDRSSKEAWRAVTFYQIGATLHDMIMGKMLFSGFDSPKSILDESVRFRTPEVKSKDIDGWLMQTVRACLLKDWRQRLQLVSWDSFFEKNSFADIRLQEKKILLLQLINAQKNQHPEAHRLEAPDSTRDQELWNLNESLILEIRTYLQSSVIFPKCSFEESKLSTQEYVTKINFDLDAERSFKDHITFIVGLGINKTIQGATNISFNAFIGETNISSSTWTEMFNAETAFEVCRKSFLDVIETMLSD